MSQKTAELSFEGMTAIHNYMFGEVYEWAGKTKNKTTSRGEAPFAAPEHIESYVNGVMKKI